MYDLVLFLCLANVHPCPDDGPWKNKIIESRIELGECIARSQKAVNEMTNAGSIFASRITIACRLSELRSQE